jgi:hypothetical protein
LEEWALELRTVSGPRMTAAQARRVARSCPAVVVDGAATAGEAIHLKRRWAGALSVSEVLAELDDTPRAYLVAGGRLSTSGRAGGGESKRKVAWFGPCPYEYGGQTFPAAPLPSRGLLAELMRSVSVEASQNDAAELRGGGAGGGDTVSPGGGAGGYNAVNVNVYSQQDSALGRHRDDEPIFVSDTVASVSFGASRRFRVWHPQGRLLSAWDSANCQLAN